MKTKNKKELAFNYKDNKDIESLLIKTFKGKDDGRYFKVAHPMAKPIVSLILIGHDLEMAENSVAKALTLKKKIHDIDDLILSALWTQVIMLYTKSFTGSDDGFTKLDVKDYIKSKKDLALHTKLMEVRNSFLAHRGYNNYQHGVLILISRKVDQGYSREYAAPIAHLKGHFVKPSKALQQYLIRLKKKVELKAQKKMAKLDQIFLDTINKSQA